MSFVDSNGCRIYYRLEGSAANPLLVLVHSLGTDHGMWDPQMPALLPHFQVLRVDLRGHGASDCPAGDYTIEMLANDVLCSTPRARFHYCGLSLGGMIGQWLAANAGERIERLVLANTSPRVGDPALFEARRTTVLTRGIEAIEQVVMERFFTGEHIASPQAESVRLVLRTTTPLGYAGCCAAIRDMDHRNILAKITAPTLVVAGDQDVSTPWAGHGDVLASAIPGAHAVRFHTAHLSNLEWPTEFNAALLEFLKPGAHDAVSRQPALKFAFEARIDVGAPEEIGLTENGVRRIIPIVGGSFAGPAISGRVHGGGADWQLVRADGAAELDARYTFETESGGLIYVSNQGMRHGPPEVLARLKRGEAVDPASYYFRTVPRFETADPSLQWLTRSVFVCTGERQASRVILQFWRVL